MACYCSTLKMQFKDILLAHDHYSMKITMDYAIKYAVSWILCITYLILFYSMEKKKIQYLLVFLEQS